MLRKDEKNKKPIGPYKKSKDIVITQSQLKKITAAILVLICIFLVITYSNPGLTHKKAKQVFIENWNKTNVNKLIDVKIIGIKQLKTDSYWVKVFYRWKELDYGEFFNGIPTPERELLRNSNRDYIYTKWDTGWFIEEKKK
jgi:hypothetical protein